MDQVRSVTDKPVTTIINTHTHGDHTGSNEFFPASVEVVAHENTKTNMLKMKQFEGDKAQFLPDRTYKDQLTLLAGADRIDLRLLRSRPHERRHDRRLSRAARSPHRRPLRVAGDSAHRSEQRRQRRRLPRHASESRRRDQRRRYGDSRPHAHDDDVGEHFVEFGEFNAAFLASVRQAVTAGKTVDEAIAGLTMPESFKDYGMQGAKDNVTKIYGELKLAK